MGNFSYMPTICINRIPYIYSILYTYNHIRIFGLRVTYTYDMVGALDSFPLGTLYTNSTELLQVDGKAISFILLQVSN
jgi:hypothetical protein